MSISLWTSTTHTAPEAVLCRRKRIRISQSLYEERQAAFTAALMSLLTTMKGIPLAYNKDMQEDKELAFDAIDTAKGCLALFTWHACYHELQKRPHGEQCKERFHQCNGRSGLSCWKRRSVPRCTWHCRTVSFCTALTKESALDDMKLEEYKADQLRSSKMTFTMRSA